MTWTLLTDGGDASPRDGNDTDSVTPLASIVAAARGGTELVVPARLLLENWLGSRDTATIEVSKLPSPVPQLLAGGGNTITVQAAQRVLVSGAHPQPLRRPGDLPLQVVAGRGG